MTTLNEIDIKEKIEKGYIHIRIILQVLGKPKEHVGQTMKMLLANLNQREKTHILAEKLFEAVEEEAGMFSTSAELELLVKGLDSLSSICFEYMPASLEIIEPQILNLNNFDLAGVFGDMLAKIHNIDMLAKSLRAQSEHDKRVLGQILRTSILSIAAEPKTTKDIADSLNIPEDQAQNILEHMVKTKNLRKMGEKYCAFPVK